MIPDVFNVTEMGADEADVAEMGCPFELNWLKAESELMLLALNKPVGAVDNPDKF
jgi:hypothetical protein